MTWPTHGAWKHSSKGIGGFCSNKLLSSLKPTACNTLYIEISACIHARKAQGMACSDPWTPLLSKCWPGSNVARLSLEDRSSLETRRSKWETIECRKEVNETTRGRWYQLFLCVRWCACRQSCAHVWSLEDKLRSSLYQPCYFPAWLSVSIHPNTYWTLHVCQTREHLARSCVGIQNK